MGSRNFKEFWTFAHLRQSFLRISYAHTARSDALFAAAGHFVEPVRRKVFPQHRLTRLYLFVVLIGKPREDDPLGILDKPFRRDFLRLSSISMDAHP